MERQKRTEKYEERKTKSDLTKFSSLDHVNPASFHHLEG